MPLVGVTQQRARHRLGAYRYPGEGGAWTPRRVVDGEPYRMLWAANHLSRDDAAPVGGHPVLIAWHPGHAHPRRVLHMQHPAIAPAARDRVCDGEQQPAAATVPGAADFDGGMTSHTQSSR